jgi:type IV pilus assembly protein PilQ
VNVPWDQALDIVLRAKSLDKRRDGNVVWVGPQDELAKYEQAREDARIALETRAETISEYIAINYGNAEEIAKLLTDDSKSGSGGGAGGAGGASAQQQRGFLSPRGSVSFDNRTNTLLVIDIPKKVQEIKELLQTLDRPVDQVLIEARIVVADENFAKELGAKFGIGAIQSNNNNRVVTSGTIENNVSLSNAANTGGTRTHVNNVNLGATNPLAGTLAFSILAGSYYIDAELSAIEQNGRGEVVSNPRVITSNQREAVIRQGQEVGYTTIQTAGGIATTTVAFKEALLELKVTPTITQDGRVYMSIEVKKNDIAGFVRTPNGDVPTLNRREVNTAVLVENGQTVVIGGVYEFNNKDDVSKVPFLGDLPFLGNFFRNKSKTNKKAELLIFITPRVLQTARR